MHTWAVRLGKGTIELAVGWNVVDKTAVEAVEAAEMNTGMPLLAMVSEEGPRSASAEAAPRSLAAVAVISAQPCWPGEL